MLKSFFCVMLFIMTAVTLNGTESAGKLTVKEFWKSINYCESATMQYITSDFTSITGKHIKDRKQTETYIQLFNQYRELVKKQKYEEASEIFRTLLDMSGAKIVKHDTRKFSELSAKERQQTIAFMKQANSFPDKYTVRKNQTMKITSFSISGNQAVANISFQDIFKTGTAKISLKKVNGKWLVCKLEKITDTP